jgi:multidrug efflux pump subunit AcrA (membrane-fusion protein)
MKRSIRLAVAGAILLAGIFLFVFLSGLRSTALPTNPPRPVPEVETITARQGDLVVEIPAQGVIEPVTVTRASAEVEGVVIAVSPDFEAGAAFKKGEVLLEIDPSDYESAVAQAEV